MRVGVLMRNEHGWPVEMMMLLLVVAVLGLRLCGSQKKEFGDGAMWLCRHPSARCSLLRILGQGQGDSASREGPGNGSDEGPVEQRSEPRSRGIVGLRGACGVGGALFPWMVDGCRCFGQRQRASANAHVLCRDAEL